MGVEDVFFAPEIEAAELKNFLHVRLLVCQAELVEHAGQVLVVGQLVQGPGHAVGGAQGIAKFFGGPNSVEQRAGFLFLVKVDYYIKLAALQLQRAGKVKPKNFLDLTLGQNGRREREPGDVAARVFLAQPPQQRRSPDNVADGPELDKQNAAGDGSVGRAISAHEAVGFVGVAGHIAPEVAAVRMQNGIGELGHRVGRQLNG